MTRGRAPLAVTLLVAVASLTACGEPDPEDTGVADALERLPSVPDDAFVNVRFTNLAKVREAVGVEVPDPDDDDAVREFLGATGGFEDGDAAMVLPTRVDGVLPPDDQIERFGFAWPQADVSVDLQAGDLDLAWYGFAEDVEPADDLEEQGDGLYAGDGRPFVAVDGKRAAVTSDQDVAEDWLADDGDSLADDDAFAELAEALDDEDVITAQLSTLGGDGGHLGIGLTVDDGDPGFVIAYRLESEDAAEDAVDGLTAAYDDLEQFDVDEIDTDGRVVTVTGTQDEVNAPLLLLSNFELPLPE